MSEAAAHTDKPRSMVVSHYDTVELSQSFIKKRRAASDGISLQTCKEWTLQLLDQVKNWHAFDAKEQAMWLARIRAGQIDADAGYSRVFVMDDGSEQQPFAPQPLITQWIETGTSGVRLLSALLDVAENPSCQLGDERFTTLKAIEQRMSHHGSCPYLEAVLSHPRIDLNQPIDKNGNLFICFCLPEYYSSSIKRGMEGAKLASYTKALQLCLANGAIVSRHYHYYNARDGLYPMVNESPLKDYYDLAARDMDALKAGTLAPQEITLRHLGRFYAAGMLAEALDVHYWHGNEDRALMLYDTLPDFVRNDGVCDYERSLLMGRLMPHTSVQRAGAQLEAAQANLHRTLTRA